MADTIHVDIVSAEGEIFSGEAMMLFVPGSQGELGIYPRHAPLLTTLKPGEVRVQSEGEEHVFYVGGGSLEIQPHLVTVLADTAARARDLDEAEALAARFRAAGFAHVVHSRVADPTPSPDAYSGRWFRDAAQLRAFKAEGALLLCAIKP